MKGRVATVALLIASCSAASADEPRQGVIGGRIVVVGTVAEPAAIDPGRDACCQTAGPVDESVLVGPDGGLANVLVSVVVRRGEPQPPEIAAPAEPAKLTNRDCAFRPRVLLARVGHPLVLANDDPTMHNVNIDFVRNSALNLVVEPDGRREIALTSPERKPAPVRCNVHPFMGGWVHVSQHGYSALSDKAGRFQLPPLPPGEWRVRFWHEGAGLSDLTVGESVTDRRGEVVVSVAGAKPLNLGQIEVPANRLR